MTSERFEVKREIAAAPAKVFAVISSPGGHVTIDASGMLQSADGPPVEKVGDEFVVHMDRESLNDRPLGNYDILAGLTVLHVDKDFELIASLTGQPIERLTA
jgi:hypothetical protein